jgi:hypothetical protein
MIQLLENSLYLPQESLADRQSCLVHFALPVLRPEDPAKDYQ